MSDVLDNAIFINEMAVVEMPESIGRRMPVPGPLVALVVRGVLPATGEAAVACVVGAPRHLGALVGRIEGMLDGAPEPVVAAFVAAYDQARAAVRDARSAD